MVESVEAGRGFIVTACVSELVAIVLFGLCYVRNWSLLGQASSCPLAETVVSLRLMRYN